MPQRMMESSTVIIQGLVLAAILWMGRTILNLEKVTVVQSARLESMSLQVHAVKESIVLAASDRYTHTMAEKDKQVILHRLKTVEEEVDSLQKWAKNAIGAKQSR